MKQLFLPSVLRRRPAIWIVLLACLATAGKASAATTISADVGADTIWTTPGSPYVVTANISVLANVRLTIRAGVIVQFQDSTGMVVYGNIVAEGSAAAPIQMTGVSATPGAWEGLSIIGGGAAQNTGSRFRHVTIEYGGNYYANLYLSNASATLRNCVIRHSADAGIYGANDGVAHIHDTAFTSNVSYAVRFYDGSVNPTLARLSASGNGRDVVALENGTLKGKHTWEATGVPYHVLSDITIDSDATLTVERGTILRFDSSVTLAAYGRLLAVGSATAPILFTGTQSTPGWWEGISIINNDRLQIITISREALCSPSLHRLLDLFAQRG